MKCFPSFSAALFLLMSGLAYTSTVNAEIYRWKDQNGRTIISDKPPMDGSVTKKVKSNGATDTTTGTAGTTPAAGATTGTTPNTGQKTIAEQELEYKKRQKEAQEKAEKEEKERADANAKKEYCAALRRELGLLESGERVAQRQDNGEKTFMDDAQRQALASKAKEGLDKLGCN